MVENSKISWTDHTYNPWRGCTKVSSGCTNCYAETMSKRNPAVLGEWGTQGTRVRGADSYLRKPLAWNKQEWWECLDCGYRGNVHTFDDYCPECRGVTASPPDSVSSARPWLTCLRTGPSWSNGGASCWIPSSAHRALTG